MRSIWKGSIAFGLVNVPVKVYAATEDHDIRFHQVHAADGGRIKYDRVCTVCGQSVQFADIDKAYESPDGDRVVLTDEDFAKLPVAEKHEIPVLQFVPSEQIDPILFDKGYYLEPDSTTPKAYVLLTKTLEQVDRVALVHFTLRQKTRLAALRVYDGVLMLQTLLWPDEVRSVDFPALADAAPPQDREVAMAETLVDSMSDDFDPSLYTDDYQIQLRSVLDEAIESGSGRVVRHEESAPAQTDAEVVDLVAALQRSLDATGSDTASDSSGKSATKKPAKKATKKTAAGKKTARSGTDSANASGTEATAGSGTDDRAGRSRKTTAKSTQKATRKSTTNDTGHPTRKGA